MFNAQVSVSSLTCSCDAAESLRRAARIAAFVLFTAVGAQLAVRLPWTPVPVTMQTLFVVLAGVVLGPRDGFRAMTAYLCLGAVGAPVFAGFAFGPAAFVGPTGGYLVAFPAAALLSGAVARARPGRGGVFIAALAGSAAILAGGTLHLGLWAGRVSASVVALAVTPFIAGELLKGVLAAALAGGNRKAARPGS